ncbi:MAG: DUF5340 domain-containing protein [Cyanophyceae cyanobacterium]
MEPIPLPSRVHYELVLQLLERQTMAAASHEPAIKEKVRQLIVILRKALAQQKQLEAICEQTGKPYDYRWSLNSPSNNGNSPLANGQTVEDSF